MTSASICKEIMEIVSAAPFGVRLGGVSDPGIEKSLEYGFSDHSANGFIV
jgi:hypothetical protein